tara:strand:- start:1063 stop:1359 length:297 start_codon:yes stop_codon:yes gene_type:complete
VAKKKEAAISCTDTPQGRGKDLQDDRHSPFTTQQQLTQTGHDLGQREGLVKSVILCDSDTLAAWTGEGSNLLTVHGSEDVLVPVDRIQERNLATITLV